MHLGKWGGVRFLLGYLLLPPACHALYHLPPCTAYSPTLSAISWVGLCLALGYWEFHTRHLHTHLPACHSLPVRSHCATCLPFTCHSHTPHHTWVGLLSASPALLPATCTILPPLPPPFRLIQPFHPGSGNLLSRLLTLDLYLPRLCLGCLYISHWVGLPGDSATWV